MIPVHLRINDAATGRPTPVRLRITGPDGTPFAPAGRSATFARGRNEDVTGGRVQAGREAFAYIDGACEIVLPPGVPLRVQALKGPEYVALDEAITLGPGQLTVRLAITRWSNVRADGWVPGDGRVHFLPPHATALEAAAEDVAVVNLLATVDHVPSRDGQMYPSAANLTAFSGRADALRTADALVAVNTLNDHPALGSVALLHGHRPIHPLTFGGDGPDDWSVCDWCDQCHRKAGLVAWADPFDPARGLVGGEALVALLMGKIDALEFDGRPRKQPLVPWWYRLLNAGVTIPPIGASGKDSNAIPLGSPRTYARIGDDQPLTYTNWIDAVRAGRCFVTNGPLLTLDVAGAGMGDIVAVDDPGNRLAVSATANSVTAFDKLEVVADGVVIGSAEPIVRDGRWSAAVELDYRVTESGWIGARCSGTMGPLWRPDQPTFAHTAAVTVRVAGRSQPRRPTELAALRRAVEQTHEWAEQAGRFTDEKWKRQLLSHCAAALATLGPGAAPTSSAAPPG